MPIITGYLIESESDDSGYKYSSLFFFSIGLVALFSSFTLLFIEQRMKRRLDKGEMRRVVDIEDIDNITVPSEYKRIGE